MRVGLYKIALPFDEPAEKVITDVIQMITIPTFSVYHPHKDIIDFKLGTTDETDESNGVCVLKRIHRTSSSETYVFPDVFSNRKILYVRSIEYRDDTSIGLSFYGGVPIHGSLMQQSMIANASSRIASKLIPRISFKWIEPNMVELFNVINSSYITFTIAFQHDKSMETIPETCRESFLQLAYLDVKQFLYNALKHYNELPSAYGTISLKIDDWSSAESDRASLLSDWDDKFHLDEGYYEFS